MWQSQEIIEVDIEGIEEIEVIEVIEGIEGIEGIEATAEVEEEVINMMVKIEGENTTKHLRFSFKGIRKSGLRLEEIRINNSLRAVIPIKRTIILSLTGIKKTILQ
jgi:hypothetical protein